MINFTLYVRGMKSSGKMLLLFAVVLVLYFAVVVWMFDPELQESLEQFQQTMPELMSAFGMGQQDHSLTGFVTSYMYGFMMLVFPMVFSILLANRLLAGAVDHGWMAYLLASPNTRIKIALTQGKVLGSGLVILILVSALSGLLFCEWLFPKELELKGFLFINLGVLALQLFIAGFCFFASCLFNETKHSLALGAGIPCLAYLVQMLANIGEEFEALKYGTFFSLYNPERLLAGESSAWWGVAILAAGALVFFVLGVFLFHKRDIPV
ncbi:ABC transporter permease [Ruminococcaceae bacterium OttesenSCG-928-I18]|nr:ABC transporter permease [Ruminococcaceae bacterium OttesenSCG-928-I18]